MNKTTYYAVEFAPIKPTTSFARASEAADREADRRQAPVTLYANGRVELIVHPARRLPCACPDDCNCRKPWRTNYCGCRQHEATA